MSATPMTANTPSPVLDLVAVRHPSSPALSRLQRRQLGCRQGQQSHEQRRQEGGPSGTKLQRHDAESDATHEQAEAQRITPYFQSATLTDTVASFSLQVSFGAEDYAETGAGRADALPRCALNPQKVTDFSEVVKVERCVAIGPRSRLFYGVLIACGIPCVMKVVERTDALEARQLRKEFFVLQHLQSLSQRGSASESGPRYEGKEGHQVYQTNILQPFAFFETETALGLVTEHLPGPDLCEYLVGHSSGRCSEAETRVVLRSLLHIAHKVHSAGFVHRDIKLANLVLRHANDLSSVTLVDFGFAAHIRDRLELHRLCGSPGSCAPEVLLEGSKDDPEKIDVFGLGVILFTLLSGCPPFIAASPALILRLNCRALLSYDDPVWNEVSCEAKDLIQQMTARNPTDRLSVQNALAHQWFTKKV